MTLCLNSRRLLQPHHENSTDWEQFNVLCRSVDLKVSYKSINYKSNVAGDLSVSFYTCSISQRINNRIFETSIKLAIHYLLCQNVMSMQMLSVGFMAPVDVVHSLHMHALFNIEEFRQVSKQLQMRMRIEEFEIMCSSLRCML